MRFSIITLALTICWTLLALALVPWLSLASDAMRSCQLKYSYETCVNTLR